MSEQITLRDSIESAFDLHGGDDGLQQTVEASNTDYEPQDAVETQSSESSRPRDEHGRFAPTKQSQEAPKDQQLVQTPQTDEQIPQEIQREIINRPSSWRKEYHEHWDKLDPTLQKYINQRESDYAKGVSMYKQNWDEVAPIKQAIEPFMQTLQQNNLDPAQWISSLGNAHSQLVYGSPEQKMQMFAKLANDYGIDLRQFAGGEQQGQAAAYNPQFSSLANELNQLKSELSSYKTLQEQQQAAVVQNEIQEFAGKHSHFEEVRETMGTLIQSGMASTLEEAYNKAIRLNDEVWQQHQQAQQAAAAQEKQRAIAEKKAKAVSPKSNSPTGNLTSSDGKKSLREELEHNFDSLFGGARV